MISSCVITGSLAEFRTCLSVGLQRSPSPPCNIDVPFGRRFHPKLLTGPLCTFSAQPVPAGVKPPHAGSVNVILHHEGHKNTSLRPPLASSLSSRHSPKSAVWEFGPSKHNNPAVSGPRLIPEKRMEQRSVKGKERAKEERALLIKINRMKTGVE